MVSKTAVSDSQMAVSDFDTIVSDSDMAVSYSHTTVSNSETNVSEPETIVSDSQTNVDFGLRFRTFVPIQCTLEKFHKSKGENQDFIADWDDF